MTAMDTLAAIGAGAPEIPRFDDGMVNINELVGTLAEALVNEIMDAQAEDACAEGNQRNGYRERRLLTSVGRITLRIPKLRSGSFFPDDVIERHRRVDRALVAAVAEMYATGTSTRKVQRVAEKIGVSRLSKDQVSAIASSLDQASRICTEGRSRARQCPTSGSTRPTSRSPLFFEIVFRKIAKAISFQRRI